MKKLLLTSAVFMAIAGFSLNTAAQNAPIATVGKAITTNSTDTYTDKAEDKYADRKAKMAEAKAKIKAFKEQYKAASSNSEKSKIMEEFKKEHPKAGARFEEFENIQKLPADERDAKMAEFKEKSAREREEREKNFSKKFDNASPEKQAEICAKINSRCADGKKNACKRAEEKCKNKSNAGAPAIN